MQNSNKMRIEFVYGGKPYKLEYTAASLKKMERSGVKFSKLDDMVFSAPEILFRGAFLANHPNESNATIHEIFKALKRTADDEEPKYDEDGNEVDALMSVIGSMIEEAINEWKGRSGNSGWKVTR